MSAIWPTCCGVAVGVAVALAAAPDFGDLSLSSPLNTNSASTTTTMASTAPPISSAPPSRDEEAAAVPSGSVAATGRRPSRRGRGRGAGLAGSASPAATATSSGFVLVGEAGRSGTSPTSARLARTVSAHARAASSSRSSLRVDWRGLPFCWPSRKSAIWAILSAGSSTSGASALRPAWARARTASSEIFRSSAICA